MCKEGHSKKRRHIIMAGYIELCQVCHSKATGFHFGIISCEGCKSFFVRECDKDEDSGPQPRQQLPTCRSGGYCNIIGRNRKKSQSCRWYKCVSEGMTRTKIRFGRPSMLNKSFMVKKKHRKKKTTPKPSDTVREFDEETEPQPSTSRALEETQTQTEELVSTDVGSVFDNGLDIFDKYTEFFGSPSELNQSKFVTKSPTNELRNEEPHITFVDDSARTKRTQAMPCQTCRAKDEHDHWIESLGPQTSFVDIGLTTLSLDDYPNLMLSQTTGHAINTIDYTENHDMCIICHDYADSFIQLPPTCQACKECTEISVFGFPKHNPFPPCKTGSDCRIGRVRKTCKSCRWGRCIQVALARACTRTGPNVNKLDQRASAQPNALEMDETSMEQSDSGFDEALRNLELPF